MCSTSVADAGPADSHRPGEPDRRPQAETSREANLKIDKPQSTDTVVPGRPCSLRASAWAWAIAIGKENGWQVRQVASKYRNTDHAPANAQERQVIDLFSRHPEINGLWEPAVAEQGVGLGQVPQRAPEGVSELSHRP